MAARSDVHNAESLSGSVEKGAKEREILASISRSTSSRSRSPWNVGGPKLDAHCMRNNPMRFTKGRMWKDKISLGLHAVRLGCRRHCTHSRAATPWSLSTDEAELREVRVPGRAREVVSDA